MKKIIFIGYKCMAPKQWSEELKNLLNDRDALILFDDNSIQDPDIYEYHGSFKFNDIWIMYGHEEIIILDESGKKLKEQHTR